MVIILLNSIDLRLSVFPGPVICNFCFEIVIVIIVIHIFIYHWVCCYNSTFKVILSRFKTDTVDSI